MLSHDYSKRHNEILRHIHLKLCNKKSLTHLITETTANKNAEIQVNTKIKTEIIIKSNDIFTCAKK